MAKGNIALSNTINITIADTPSGLGEFNTNTICLFSNEQPLSVEPYLWAVSAQDVINEYGADSLTAKMAIGIFSPSQNLRTGRGQLLVFPFDGVNATSGTLTTQAITAEVIQAFQAVANGDLTIEIDGQDYIATKLNFSAISQVDDIVTILENIGLDVDIEVVNTNQIKFTSRNTGTNSAVAIKATSEGAGTDLYGGAPYHFGDSCRGTAAGRQHRPDHHCKLRQPLRTGDYRLHRGYDRPGGDQPDL
jgi:hypothetical protein